MKSFGVVERKFYFEVVELQSSAKQTNREDDGQTTRDFRWSLVQTPKASQSRCIHAYMQPTLASRTFK